MRLSVLRLHAKLFGGLALVAFMVREHLQDVALFELPDRLVISHSGSVHLRNQNIELAFQRRPPPLLCLFMRSSLYIVPLLRLVDPIG